MAKYAVQIRVQSSSSGYAAVEVPPYNSSWNAPKNEWRPWYSYYTFKPIDYADASRFQILPFIKWVIQITPNEFVTAEMLSDITGGRTTIESSSPSFSPFNNVDKEYDADGMPVLSVKATVYFATGDPSVDPPPAGKKRVVVTAINGTPPDTETNTASGTVSVNGNISETTASATGLVDSEGTDQFAYTVSASPAEDYVFDHWSDGDTQQTKTGQTRISISFTAYFKKKHTVKIYEHDINGQLQEVRINAPYVNGNYQGYHEQGEEISIYFTPAQGATPVRFRGARKDGDTETLLWNADGETTKTFTMPDADVVVAIGCFYDQVTVTPQLYTDEVLDSAGGSVSPPSASGKNEDTVSFTATANTENDYHLGIYEGGYVWDWVGSIFDLDGQSSTRYGNQSSATLSGDASITLQSLPSWTGMDDLDAKWFMRSSYDTPNVYFYWVHLARVIIQGIAHTYVGQSLFDLDITTQDGEQSHLSFQGGFQTAIKYDLSDESRTVNMLPKADSGYFVYKTELWGVWPSGNRFQISSGSYTYSGGDQLDGMDAQSASILGTELFFDSHADGMKYEIHSWVWPKTTHQILYSPTNNGAIIYGSGGCPMAQYL